MSLSETDRIERQILLRVPRSRVWRALTDPVEFGTWFERMEPERVFSWRWHPYAVEPGVDYSAEPATLVVFELEEVAGGTLLTVVESGFDDVSLARRAQAYRMNGEGWTAQMGSIERYVATAA